MSRAFVFPGQGSQAVGMGKELAEAFAEAREVFEEVDEALKQKLSALMFEGPEDQLTLTENAQPALMAVSLAVVRVLEAQGGFSLADKATFVAGHSLGEYSALAASRALGISDTARLLKTRGQAMQKAGLIWILLRRSLKKPGKARFAPPPMIMPTGRSSSAAIKARSSAPLIWPRQRGQSARCYCP